MDKPNIEKLREVRGVGPKRFEAILANLSNMEKSVDDLFVMPADDIRAIFKLPRNVAEAIASIGRNPISASKIDPIAAKGIKTLSLNSDGYPSCLVHTLGASAPKVLYLWGNLDLLCKPGVGFCGSRAASEKGLAVTADVAAQIANLGWVVISGHARGVDATAHRTALENGGSTIIVAPEGILAFKLRQELKKLAKLEQLLIISEFPPNAKWNVGQAMTRNKTIIGLSSAMVLVEARGEGGTFEAGKMALKLNVPLFVTQYQTQHESTQGNEYFLSHGAIPLLKNPDTSRARIDKLREIVTTRASLPDALSNASLPLQQLPLI